MTKHRGVSLLLLAALTLGAGAAPGAAQALAGDPARLQADAFLQRARSSFEAGALQDALDLLAPALEIDPGYSEALYLRARIELSHRATTLAAVGDLRSAIAGGSWTRTDPHEAERSLADVLLRTGRLADARALLRRLAAEGTGSPQTFELLARLYARERDTGALRRTLANGRAAFPLDDELALLAADLGEGRRSEARMLIARQLEEHPGSAPLVLRAAELAETPGARVADVERYAGLGGKDPLAAVIALEAPARDRQKYLSQFVENGGLAREDLVGRVAAAIRGSGSLTATFRSELSRYTGNRDLDPDGNGWVERWKFQDGAVTSWVRDTARDGRPDYEAEFRGGKPISIAVRSEAGSVLQLSYGPYPFVQSVSQPPSPGAERRTWMLDPFTLRFPFLAATAPEKGLSPRTLADPGRPSLARILQSAYREHDYAPDGVTVVRSIDFDHGKKIFMEEDTLGEGTSVFNHRVWYENGQPVRGARDPDGTGRFSISETWADGRLAAIAVDTRGDGKITYRERYLPSPMKSWDYDEDGIPDAREYPRGPHTIVRDFSTAMNGVFDLSFVWKNDALVSVVRRGRSVPVTHDAQRGVVWIGRPPPVGAVFDAGGPEGYRSVGGRLYFVFRREGVTYAEESS